MGINFQVNRIFFTIKILVEQSHHLKMKEMDFKYIAFIGVGFGYLSRLTRPNPINEKIKE